MISRLGGIFLIYVKQSFQPYQTFFHYNEKSLLIPRKKKMLVENAGLFVLLLLFAFFIHTG
ncbi:hypothetical protein DW989_14805 [Bacteroides stercoris]|nr:hypothetical protein DW989_14805 [Bacteroides stercoris]RYT52749.1 hypothetical protein EAJ09_14775 [Bacteroides stercoris]